MKHLSKGFGSCLRRSFATASGLTRKGLGFACTAALVWVMLVLVMLALERWFIYFPIAAHVAAPADYGLRAEPMEVVTDVRLRGWWIRGGGRFVLIWFDGNAGNISHRLPNAKELVDRLQLDLVQLDYRGYGRSEGTPQEDGLLRDAAGIYDEVRSRGVGADRIVVFGRSLGAAITLHLAVEREVAGTILETPFLSVPDLARVHYPFVPSRLVRTRFDNTSRIARLRAPLLLIHGDQDEVVPYGHGVRLFELAPGRKRLFTIPGAMHNDTWLVGGSPYFAAWEEFLAGLERM